MNNNIITITTYCHHNINSCNRQPSCYQFFVFNLIIVVITAIIVIIVIIANLAIGVIIIAINILTRVTLFMFIGMINITRWCSR